MTRLQSDSLADYIAVQRHEDLNHTIFPGRNWEEVQVEMEKLAQDLVPLVNTMLDHYLDSLYLPNLQEIRNTPIMSVGFPHWLAYQLDILKPEWNLVQKAIFYGYYLQEAWKASVKEFERRVAEKRSKEGKEDAKRAIVPEDPSFN